MNSAGSARLRRITSQAVTPSDSTAWHLRLPKNFRLGGGSAHRTGTTAKESMRESASAGIRPPGCSAPCPPPCGLPLDLRRTPRQPDPQIAWFAGRSVQLGSEHVCCAKWSDPQGFSKAALRSSGVGVHAKVRSRRSPKGGGHERRGVPPPCCESSTKALTGSERTEFSFSSCHSC